MFDKAEPEEPEKACLLWWLKSGAVSMFLLRRASANLELAVFVSETEMQRSLGNKQDSPNHEQSYGGGWAQGLRVESGSSVCSAHRPTAPEQGCGHLSERGCFRKSPVVGAEVSNSLASSRLLHGDMNNVFRK